MVLAGGNLIWQTIVLTSTANTFSQPQTIQAGNGTTTTLLLKYGGTSGPAVRVQNASIGNYYDSFRLDTSLYNTTGGNTLSRAAFNVVKVNPFPTAVQQEFMRADAFSDAARVSLGGNVLSGVSATFYQKAAADKAVVARLAPSATGNAFEAQNSSGTTLSAIRPDGSWQPPSLTDSAAVNNSLYYSTTQSKLCFKDPSGVSQPLY